MRNVEAKQAWMLHCDYIREKNVKGKTQWQTTHFLNRGRNVEAKQARMLHPDYFHGKNVKYKACLLYTSPSPRD